MSQLVEAIRNYSSEIEEFITINKQELHDYIDNLNAGVHSPCDAWLDVARRNQVVFRTMKQYFPFDRDYVMSDVFAENEDIRIKNNLVSNINKCNDDINDMIMNQTSSKYIIHKIKGVNCVKNKMVEMVNTINVTTK